MSPISETRRAVEWQALIDQYPTTFTWDGDTYTGRFTDSRGYQLDPVQGGFLQDQTAQLYCLRSSFTNGAPGEGDIIQALGLGWRINGLTLAMSFGIVYQLSGPEKMK